MNTNPVEYPTPTEALSQLLREAVGEALAALIRRKDANSVALRAMLHQSDKKETSRLPAAQEHERERRYTKAMPIREFCKNNDICASTYFNLKRKGLGPREMAVGNRVMITPEAEADWRREREEHARRLAKTEAA